MKEENNKEKLSKNFWICLISICSILFILIIIGFVLFSNRKPSIIEKEEDGGKAFLKYSSNTNIYTVKEAKPTIDAVGVKVSEDGKYFDFSVDTSLIKASSIEYEISVKKISGKANNSDIKVYLEKEDSGTYNSLIKPQVFKPLKENSELGSPKGSMVLTKVINKKSKIDNYRLRSWLSDSSILSDDTYSLEIILKARAK